MIKTNLIIQIGKGTMAQQIHFRYRAIRWAIHRAKNEIRRGGLICGLAALSALFSAQRGVAQETQGPSDTLPSTDAEQTKGFLEIVFSGGPVGVVIVMTLIALSITAAYLIIDHLLTVRRSDVMPEGLGERVKSSLANRQYADAQKECNENPSVLSFVLLHGITEIEYGWSAVEKAIEDALAEQSARMYRKIEYLSVIGSIAPMVGLLGTVVGMILAFQKVAATQATAGAPQLAEGIYQALVTTVGGLIVAIPAIGAFAIFRNRIDQFVAETGYIAQHVFGPLRRKKKESR